MVLYEDNHLLIVNKPSGMLVQGDRTRDKTILDEYKYYIKKKYDKPGAVFLNPVHRLDRPVSGCLMLARTSKGASRMTEAFRLGKVKKVYHAVSDKALEHLNGNMVDYMIKDEKKNISRIIPKGQNGGKRAELSYEMVAQTKGFCLYRVYPETGRSHQIRLQLSHSGAPIVGDRKYKGAKNGEPGMIYLHCSELEFDHPTRKEPIVVSCFPVFGSLWTHFHDYLQPTF